MPLKGYEEASKFDKTINSLLAGEPLSSVNAKEYIRLARCLRTSADILEGAATPHMEKWVLEGMPPNGEL